MSTKGHSFEAGDVVYCTRYGPPSVYWIINKEQYISLELYAGGAEEGHQGLRLSCGASMLNWEHYVKICTIDQIRHVLISLKVGV